MIKWAVGFVVNRLMLAGFVFLVVNGLHGPACEASSGLMGQIDHALLGWTQLLRALDEAR